MSSISTSLATTPRSSRPTFALTPKQVLANRLLGGDAKNILLRGGSRSGKTFLIIRALVIRALAAPGSRHAVWRFHFNHAKNAIGRDTFPKVMRLCYPDIRYNPNDSEGIYGFPNGSELWLGGLDDKERVEKILGLEFASNFFSECSQIPYHAVETAQTRLAQLCEIWEKGKPTGRFLRLRNYFDMNPPGKRHYSHDLWVKHIKPGTREPVRPGDYVEMQMNPDDNRQNLPAEYFEVLDGMSATKRKRYRDGEWANDVEGSLWHDATLDRARVGACPVRLRRVVIGVDPSGSKGKAAFALDSTTSNDIGIVVAGYGDDGNAYVLEDATCNLSPAQWASVVCQKAEFWGADRVVAEANFGGAMVEHTLKTARRTLPVKMVSASRGKAVRAEPVAALYEQNKVFHCGYFGELEEQMGAMMPQPIGYTGDGSPDRVDALVWCLTELMLTGAYSLGNLG